MKTIASYSVLMLAIAYYGCQKPGPVELVDEDLQSQNIELIKYDVPPGSAFGCDDVDSSGYFPTVAGKTFGQLVVSGSEYDTPYEHHEASLARAIFFDRSLPVIYDDDTVAYRTLDPGVIQLNGVPLLRQVKRLTHPLSPADSILGYQNSLVGGDGVGGFQFTASFAYQWQGFGSSSLLPFSASIISPPILHITSPKPADVVSLTRNLPIRWEGGGTAIRLLISDTQTGLHPRPIIELRSKVNRGIITIPLSILKMLPKDRSRFVFTVLTENAKVEHINGFNDDMLIQSTYSHNLVLRVRR